jgi:hypothetical protein
LQAQLTVHLAADSVAANGDAGIGRRDTGAANGQIIEAAVELAADRPSPSRVDVAKRSPAVEPV